MSNKRLIFRENWKFNPLKKVERRDLKGWDIGNMTILFHGEEKKNFRNIVCECLEIKHLVFGDGKKKKK